MRPICAVVVTYKTRDLLRRCLRSIDDEFGRLGLPSRIVVVDNASGDGTREMVSSEFPGVEYIENDENVGPARGFNQALERGLAGGASSILIANSDIWVRPGSIAALWRYLEDHPKVSGCTGRLLNEDGSPQYQRMSLFKVAPEQLDKALRIEWVGSGFGLVRADVYRRVGGFDENFYFFNEDLDWVIRAKRAREVFMLIPDAPVVHRNHGGMSQNISRITRELYSSNVYVYKRHFRLLLWPAVMAMRLELWGKAIRLRAELRKARASDQPDLLSLENTLADIREARLLLDEEVRKVREPKIPTFGQATDASSSNR